MFLKSFSIRTEPFYFNEIRLSMIYQQKNWKKLYLDILLEGNYKNASTSLMAAFKTLFEGKKNSDTLFFSRNQVNIHLNVQETCKKPEILLLLGD